MKKSMKKMSKVIRKKTGDVKTKLFFLTISNPITSLGNKIANIFEPHDHYGMNDSDDYEWRLRHMSENKGQSENSKEEK